MRREIIEKIEKLIERQTDRMIKNSEEEGFIYREDVEVLARLVAVLNDAD